MKVFQQVSKIKLYRKLRYRKGHGVHSPFVYAFITKVIEEKAPFYAFEEIEKLTVANQTTRYRNIGILLFRIITFLKCRTVLQIGDSNGIISLYLAMAASRHCNCHVLTGSTEIQPAVRNFARLHHLNKLHWIGGDQKQKLKHLQESSLQVDLLFINQLQKSMDTKESLALCRSFIHQKTVLIINHISQEESMKALWKQIKNDPQARVVLDLHALGIVFFDDNLPKKQYKTYFDYGEKQNLYANRGRRFYLIGGRKKSFQDASSY